MIFSFLYELSLIRSQMGDMARRRSTTWGTARRISSISSGVFRSPTVRRRLPWATSWGRPMARRTWLGSSDPEVQAEPEEAQMSWLSDRKSVV